MMVPFQEHQVIGEPLSAMERSANQNVIVEWDDLLHVMCMDSSLWVQVQLIHL